MISLLIEALDNSPRHRIDLHCEHRSDILYFTCHGLSNFLYIDSTCRAKLENRPPGKLASCTGFCERVSEYILGFFIVSNNRNFLKALAIHVYHRNSLDFFVISKVLCIGLRTIAL